MRNLVVLDAPPTRGCARPPPAPCQAAANSPAPCASSGSCGGWEPWRAGSSCRRATTGGDWKEGDGVFNAPALASYTRRLADRVERHVRDGDFPVVLGGDCSIRLGASLALRRLGRYGLAAVDASHDFRHPGNSTAVGAAGGEEVALATGRGQDDLTDLEGLKPYLRDEDVRFFGIRDAFADDTAETRRPEDARRHRGRTARVGPRDGRRRHRTRL